jgi:hypothetical protein
MKNQINTSPRGKKPLAADKRFSLMVILTIAVGFRSVGGIMCCFITRIEFASPLVFFLTFRVSNYPSRELLVLTNTPPLTGLA